MSGNNCLKITKDIQNYLEKENLEIAHNLQEGVHITGAIMMPDQALSVRSKELLVCPFFFHRK